MNKGFYTDNLSKFKGLAERYQGMVTTNFNQCFIGRTEYQPGV